MPSKSVRQTATLRWMMMLLAVGWCIVLVGVDAYFAAEVTEQITAGDRYLPVEATIVESEVQTRSRHSRGSGRSSRPSCYPSVVYEYEVDGRDYTADRIHLFVWGSSDGREAREMVERFPEGIETTAYYDPDDPASARLLPGAAQVPAAMLLFFTPFHCVAIGVPLALFMSRSRGYTEPSLRQAIARDDGATAVLRSRAMPAWGTFLAVLGVGSFAATFGILFTAGSSAGWPTVLTILASITGVALVLAAVTRLCRPPRVTLDRARRMLTRRGVGLPFDSIAGIEVRQRPWKGGGPGSKEFSRFTLVAERTGGCEPLELVRQIGLEDHSEPLAAWLREQIGLPA